LKHLFILHRTFPPLRTRRETFHLIRRSINL